MLYVVLLEGIVRGVFANPADAEAFAASFKGAQIQSTGVHSL